MTQRFHAPQSRDYPLALRELRHGRKLTHWIWWIFPQLASLGRSARALEYGLRDLDEARDYLADPLLRARLIEAAQAVLSHPGTPIEQIMGPVDALKLRSCATLFEAASPDAATRAPFTALIDTFYGGTRCPLTLAEIARSGG
ncbi:DUF1810 domain-containing protein [Sedimentimonas flavescens]|uniref:DUF1810 domain-containing protein n=1 Tax=Sedimentimonas flavescens TaxID=2851012 RepID=A0ABT2ZYG6_9RHOB|nr:DUF1810 domain-containing protein [Sedimentimonas flavescens]MCV2878789.1 DUF1810 domain-containing protein [Sedimentimonas flavescens]